MLSTILSTGDTIVNKTDQSSIVMELTFQWESHIMYKMYEVHGMFDSDKCNGEQGGFRHGWI